MSHRLVAVARILVAASLIFAVTAASTAPAATARTRTARKHKHKAKRCKRGKVRVKARHRSRCVKVKHLPKRAKMPSVHRLRTQALRRVPRRLRVHRHTIRAPRIPKAMLRALAKGERRFAAATAHASRAASARAITARDGGWKTKITQTGGDTATLTVSKGSQHMKLTADFFPTVGDCPDADGKDAGRAPYVFNVDAEFPTTEVPDGWPRDAPRPATAFMHIASDLRARTVSHDDDGAHLVDFDMRGKDIEHVQVGLKDAAGKVLTTNEPELLTVTFKADHIKPEPEGTQGDDAWGHDLLAKTTMEAHATNWPQDAPAMYHDPLVKWLLAASATSTAYKDVEAKHWQKDCLDVQATGTPHKLRSSEHAQVTVSGVTAKGGTLNGPVPLTMTAEGSVSPTSATWTGAPVRLDYTAPAGSWIGSGVTIKAASRMGVGYAHVTFEHNEGQIAVRLTSTATDTFGDGSDGEHGSATFALRSVVPLTIATDSPRAYGSAPLTWTTFAYHDDGTPEPCQAGGFGHEDYDGTGADPGVLSVQNGLYFDPDPSKYSVTFTITPPVEHYLRQFFPDDTTCGYFSSTSDHTLWLAHLTRLGSLPGVTYSTPQSPTSWTVSGGFRAGSGDVVMYRDLDAGDVHLRIEVLRLF